MPRSNAPLDRDPAAAANCTALNLRMATRAVSQFYDAAIAESGLTGTQYSLLAVASRAGPLPMSRLAGALVMDRTTLSRNLKPLERAGLVTVVPGEDRRSRQVTVTEAGRAAHDRAKPLWAKAQASVVERLGEDDWAVLIAGLRKAVAAVR